MSLLSSRTPMQLLAQTGFGIVLAASGFMAGQADDALFRSHKIAFGIMMLGSVAAGFWLSTNAEGELKNGIAAQRWSDKQIEPVQRLGQSSALFALMVICLVAACFVMFSQGWHLRGYGWACMLTGQSLSRLSMALKSPPPESPRTNIWTDMKPINSQHWGSR